MEADVNSQVLPALGFANNEKVFARLPNSLGMPQNGYKSGPTVLRLHRNAEAEISRKTREIRSKMEFNQSTTNHCRREISVYSKSSGLRYDSYAMFCRFLLLSTVIVAHMRNISFVLRFP